MRTPRNFSLSNTPGAYLSVFFVVIDDWRCYQMQMKKQGRLIRQRGVIVGLLITMAAGLNTGCLKQAVPAPLPPPNATVEERQALFQAHELTRHKSFFSERWERADGKYSFPQLKVLAKIDPQLEENYSSAKSRRTVISIVGGVGGGVVGYTLGYNLAAPSSRRWSGERQLVAYSVGAGLIVTALILDAAWADPADVFADEYNRALRRQTMADAQLGPSGTSPPSSSMEGSFVPSLSLQGLGLTF